MTVSQIPPPLSSEEVVQSYSFDHKQSNAIFNAEVPGIKLNTSTMCVLPVYLRPWSDQLDKDYI